MKLFGQKVHVLLQYEVVSTSMRVTCRRKSASAFDRGRWRSKWAASARNEFFTTAAVDLRRLLWPLFMVRHTCHRGLPSYRPEPDARHDTAQPVEAQPCQT